MKKRTVLSLSAAAILISLVCLSVGCEKRPAPSNSKVTSGATSEVASKEESMTIDEYLGTNMQCSKKAQIIWEQIEQIRESNPGRTETTCDSRPGSPEDTYWICRKTGEEDPVFLLKEPVDDAITGYDDSPCFFTRGNRLYQLNPDSTTEQLIYTAKDAITQLDGGDRMIYLLVGQKEVYRFYVPERKAVLYATIHTDRYITDLTAIDNQNFTISLRTDEWQEFLDEGWDPNSPAGQGIKLADTYRFDYLYGQFFREYLNDFPGEAKIYW